MNEESDRVRVYLLPFLSRVKNIVEVHFMSNQEGSDIGIKLTRDCLNSVFNVADDCFIFRKAPKRTARNIRYILDHIVGCQAN